MRLLNLRRRWIERKKEKLKENLKENIMEVMRRVDFYQVEKNIEKIRAEDCIFHIFNYIKDNTGKDEFKQEVEAIFWENFFEYFKNLDRTEQNRIIDQLGDLVEEGE